MILLSSVHRPEKAERFLKTVTLPGVLILEEGDEADYRGIPLPMGWRTLVLEPGQMPAKIHSGLCKWPTQDWYAIASDDFEPETPEWDRICRDAAGDWCMSWGDQKLTNPTSGRASMVFYGGELARAIGWLIPPWFDHFYVDDVQEHIARHFGIGRYLPDVNVRHQHWTLHGKPDKTAKTRRGDSARGKQQFADWLGREWPVLREKLDAVIPQEVRQ